jgi:DNA-nicking Smr family endonuclease
MARRLGEQEKALWGRVIATVEPLNNAKPKIELKAPPVPAKAVRAPATTSPSALKARPARPAVLPRPPHNVPHNLDGHWDRRIDKGGIVPDVSVDLHDTGLSGAYARLDRALEQAIAQKMKVVLLVTGKPRAHDRASGEGRGAIASVVRDWLASSRHASSIAAVRGAHPRHGGTGALYIVLKR